MIYFSMLTHNQATEHPKAVWRLLITELKSGVTKKADTWPSQLICPFKKNKKATWCSLLPWASWVASMSATISSRNPTVSPLHWTIRSKLSSWSISHQLSRSVTIYKSRYAREEAKKDLGFKYKPRRAKLRSRSPQTFSKSLLIPTQWFSSLLTMDHLSDQLYSLTPWLLP